MHFDNAKTGDIVELTAFAEAELEKYDPPMKAMLQINIAIDEIYSNIVKFAYGDATGPADVMIGCDEAKRVVSIVFEDEGTPYNPLDREDPDITLSIEERGIGGLGLFMVKKIMDDVIYNYDGTKNILTLKKNI